VRAQDVAAIAPPRLARQAYTSPVCVAGRCSPPPAWQPFLMGAVYYIIKFLKGNQLQSLHGFMPSDEIPIFLGR